MKNEIIPNFMIEWHITDRIMAIAVNQTVLKEEKMEGKILLVEDSKMIQEIYKNKLLFEKFNVITADNGAEGIKVLAKETPDLILLDLMMPIMDGYKVLQVIKTDSRLKSIPVIVFSAKGQPGEVEKAMQLGASDYIVKATTKPAQVVERIKKVLSERTRSKSVVHYRLKVDVNALDAPLVSSDFNMNNLKCTECGTIMVFDMIPDFSEGTNWFSGKFICPECSNKE
ncbi:transcriptional regulatory protein SrrA [bacterium BMS3Abin07]|nr:transcriptional regulatory protein SrrA [bacterium BMS3Abin07]GBE31413.1 transcriptional regulatory protein SrrA [bacterium BMS3Bbin05]HDL21242.1 response regulator [Nitrospirota bacterium]HDO22194.1 response regulator [Nitrospirota bacterium]HDZ87336.1 response regulator [Nitrospirota bacterium]